MGSNQQGPAIGIVQEQDFICVVKDDFYRLLTFIDTVTGQWIDVTSWQFFMKIYKSWSSKALGEPPLISIDNASGFTFVSPTQGQIGLFIPETKTNPIGIVLTSPYGMDVPQYSAVYDILAIDQNDVQQTRIRGSFIFQMGLSA